MVPYVGFVFGFSVVLLDGMWLLNMGTSSPFDEAYVLWGSLLYLVCSIITNIFIFTLIYNQIGYTAYRKSTAKLTVLVLVQSIGWFYFLPWFAVKCSRTSTKFESVAHFALESWMHKATEIGNSLRSLDSKSNTEPDYETGDEKSDDSHTIH